MGINNHRGTALLEAIPATVLLSLVVGAVLTGAYLIFGKAWIQYQSEQSLYCMAKGDSVWTCTHQLQARLDRFLPWGTSHASLQTGPDKWIAEVKWTYEGITLNMHKELSPALLLQKKVLRW